VAFYDTDNTPEETEWLNDLRIAITGSSRMAKEIHLRALRLVTQCNDFTNVDYDFLYDSTQNLFTIGYNADEHRQDNSFYDLLASECRLTTYIAVAQGKLPQQSWFALGRQLTNFGTDPILLSWSGSMFEYLMPLLVMPTYENTLLDQTNKSVIKRQIEYCRSRNIPWGISESGYSNVDAHLNYQYRAFGVPGLGFKRGLATDLVIAPYATIMGLMVAPSASYENLQVMKEKGFEGRYGFYEAIDYTSARLPRRTPFAIIKSFMAHHQGMSFLSLSFLLHNQPMQRRFETNVEVKSALLLLQERIPRITTFYSPTVHESDVSVSVSGNESMRVINTPHTAVPEVQLLSNGRYHVMLTNSGGGYSRWKNISLTRWREDGTMDNWGSFCYIRDLENNNTWSASFQPSLKEGENYEAVFSQGRAEFRRRDLSIETHTEVIVSPEDDVELRRVHINNRSRKKRYIEVTSYAEVVLASAAADEAHPAFSNLFVQTEINEYRHAIICSRRPRTAGETNPFMFHLMKAHGAEIHKVTYETDRDKFIGRGNTVNNPGCLKDENGLSGKSGSVLDPIISIQYRIYIEPYKSVIVDIITGAAENKDTCNMLVERYQDKHIANRGLELAWTHSQVILRQINANEADAQLYNRLAGSIIFANSSLRADPQTIIKNHRGQSALWSYSISGDLPIVLLQIEESSSIDLVKKMVQAHAYWRLKGLIVDLIIWNDDHGGYRQEFNDRIHALVVPGASANLKDQPGGIFIRSTEQISNEDRILFQTVAHVMISDKLGTLDEQINRGTKSKNNIPLFSPTKFHTSVDSDAINDLPLPAGLQFFNGYGGFSSDGKEYIIKTTGNQATPAPWINVLGNPEFGTVVTENGQSYTWVENAHEIRLTPWNNDPITDLKGEAFYLRDEESGRFWSPSALPAKGSSPYITKHGFGYSTFEHSEDGIFSSMNTFVAIDAPVKFIVLKIKNNSSRPRKISATGYVEWVLGDLKSKAQMHTITEFDARSGAILATNAYSSEFENRVAFFDVDDTGRTFTTDRMEFIGRNGTMQYPEAMNRVRLSGKRGAGLDPCAALQAILDLPEDGEKQITFRLGAGKSMNEALEIIENYEGNAAAEAALQKVISFWTDTLGNVQIQTPDAATNILTNGWLNYQTLSCRIWARSGFYQSGGAFGFRDQLQDVLSLLHTKPALVKEQILLCASRQFIEGDVQHWWHPPKGRGVRTTCSDDYLWLPFVASKYVLATGDQSILEEQINNLEGRLLNAGEESYYDLPIRSDKRETLYEHCVRAIEHGLKFGEHGLPFIGSGDWNDGMDKVGEHGRGESVWLAFFLYDILIRFAETAKLKNDQRVSELCLTNAATLKTSINKNAWDGEWFRRAYFDDGTPLGSKANEECKIDSIAQSWSVLSGAGDPQYSKQGMESADKYLVRKEDGMIQLFDPPFDKSALNPGYIKGYVPGVRENGGQYTHAAIWLIMGFAALGDRKRTWALLQMINPLNRSLSPEKIKVYRSEPYVIAADVYAEPSHKGRGGWTWYTGSAGWMYQLVIESFLGLKRTGNTLSFHPCVPEEWGDVKLTYQFMDTKYDITIKAVPDNALEEAEERKTVLMENLGGIVSITI
jgi:cellobiose phosphorylase